MLMFRAGIIQQKIAVTVIEKVIVNRSSKPFLTYVSVRVSAFGD